MFKKFYAGKIKVVSKTVVALLVSAAVYYGVVSGMGRGAAFLFIVMIVAAIGLLALRSSQHRYRCLAESLPDAVVILDRQSCYKYVNPTAALWLGRPASEIIGRNRADFFPADTVRHHQVIVENVLSEGRMIVTESKIPFEDAERWVEIRTIPLAPALGEPELVIAICRDITERRRFQDEILRACSVERQKIGCDLHDGLGQHLSGIALKAKLLENNLRDTSSVHAGEMGNIIGLLNQGIAQTRSLAQLLAPVDVEFNGLQAALTKLSSEMGGLFQVDVVVTSPPEANPVDIHIGTALYRIAQEAVHNAVRHGTASRIELNLLVGEGDVCLTIRDNGIGFSIKSDSSQCESGMGLRIMSYRAKMAGGSVSFESVPGNGATVTCRIPLESSQRLSRN
jgi:PAS domain S-box-containing protein